MVIQITTAGYDRESLCYEQYSHAKRVLEDPDVDRSFYAYVAEAGEDEPYDEPATWEAANPSFGRIMGADFYSDQITKQPESEFRRFYLNQWTRSSDSWLPAGAWESCRSDLDIPDGAPVYVGVDVALYHDNTAVVVVHRTEDDRLVVRSKTWAPTEDSKTDVAEVMDYIRRLADRYDVAEVTYDPRFFDYPAAVLADEGIVMVEFPQSADRMVPACGYAYEQIAAGNVAHDGDFVLTEHVLSAEQRPGERGWTLSKGKSKHVIDACIAMVIAMHRSIQTPEPDRSWVGAWA